jgi:hypothetical protein
MFAFFLRQASEQYNTCSQFLAQALRQVMSRPHALQGLLGKLCLLPLKDVVDLLKQVLHVKKLNGIEFSGLQGKRGYVYT